MTIRPEVVDADAHVAEDGAFFSELFARFGEFVEVRRDTKLGVLIEGRPYPNFDGPAAGCPPEHGLSTAAGLDPTTASSVVANADADGIDHMVLFPSFALGVPGYRDRALSAGVARLYNQWVADFVSSGEGRLHAMAVLPVEFPDDAIAVASEARELGLVGVVLPPALRERNLDHRDLDPLYDVLVDLDMAVGIHGAPGQHLPPLGADRFTNYIQVHCLSFPFDQLSALTALASGGVFERHRNLRVALLEAGAGWLPWFIERLDEHFEARGDWIEEGWQRPPSDYVAAGNVMVTCEPDEHMLSATVTELGPGCVMYASDYPHWDGSWPQSSAQLLVQPLPEPALAQVAGANARRFYRI